MGIFGCSHNWVRSDWCYPRQGHECTKCGDGHTCEFEKTGRYKEVYVPYSGRPGDALEYRMDLKHHRQKKTIEIGNCKYCGQEKLN